MSAYQFETRILPGLKKTLLRFQLKESAQVKLKIMNNHEAVRLLLNEMLDAGMHEVEFHFGALLPGQYDARLIVNTTHILDISSTIINIKPSS